MADIRINQVETNIDIADIDALLSPQVMERLVQAVKMRLQQEQNMQKLADDDRRLVEGASR
ncbi:MAG: hypothetical protein ACI82S_000814 [Patiriisocius sp.]